MGIIYKEYRTPIRLRNKWRFLYNVGQYTPFQAWHICFLWFLLYGLKSKYRKYRALFYYFVDESDGYNECIIPVLVNNKDKILANFSQFGPIDFYDLIYSFQREGFLKDCIHILWEKYQGFKFTFENVPEWSVLCNLLDGCEHQVAPCVKIEFHSTNYEEYYQSLSKHQRQNLRTAYNRLQMSGKPYNVVKFDTNNRIPRRIHKECMMFYEERCMMKNGGRRCKGVLSQLAAAKDRKTNLVNMLVDKGSNAVFVFFIEKQAAAYLVCFYDDHRPIVFVPRLSANVKYLKYDPGILLLNEAIKRLLVERIGVVDLTRGDEPYKIAMGGVVYNNYTFRKSL